MKQINLSGLSLLKTLILLLLLGGGDRVLASDADPTYAALMNFAGNAPKEQILFLGHKTQTGNHIGKKLRIFIDPQHQDEAAAAAAMLTEQAYDSVADVPNFGPHTAKLWALLTIHNYESTAKTVYLEFDYSVAQHITLAKVDESGILSKKFAGSGESYSKRDKLTRTNIFSEQIQPGNNVFLIATWGKVAQQMPLRLWTPDDFYQNELKRRTFVDIIIGCALALLFYNIFLFVSLKDPLYFIYCCYLLCNIVYHGLEHGFFREHLYFTSGIETLPDWTNIVIVDVILINVLLFAQRFSEVRTKSPLGILFVGFMSVAMLNILNTLVFSSSMALYICTYNTSGGMALCIFTGLVRYGKAEQQARLYTLAWSFYLIGATGTVLNYLGFIERNMITKYGLLIGGMLEMILLSFVLAGRIKKVQKELQDEQQKKLHSYEQLEKVFYPHQLAMIKQGIALEVTMPTNTDEACVICFDVMGSTRIQDLRAKEFLRSIFQRCNQIMMEGYDRQSLVANAYRVKEMGDGFLCSVGYPFRSLTNHLGEDAVRLALRFHQVFCEEAKRFEFDEPVYCGIGIALDNIAGFYPESGTKEYDLYGKAIILATRYEGMRKVLLADRPVASILILQERVIHNLGKSSREKFTCYSLSDHGKVVRDDPNAERLYFQILDKDEESGKLSVAS